MRHRLILPTAISFAVIGSGAFAQVDTQCADQTCFLEAVRACEPGSFRVPDPGGLGAEGEYSVVGPVGGVCEIAFTFSENPNPAFLNKPLTFVVDPDDASEETILGGLESCLSAAAGAYQCAGPLFEQVAGGAQVRGALVAGEGPLPCGQPVDVAGDPLYPMPQDGEWGYVDRDGEWRIMPQWDRVEEFHEGRANVGGQYAWGIIDREGDYVVPQEFEGASVSTIGEERWATSPFAPYSEGCTVANIFTDRSQPTFFIDSDGTTYWREERPEALRSRDIRAFGMFSEGLAWFRQDATPDDLYGWIDPTGSVVIEAEYSDAGDFSGGLAPASVGDGLAGFISNDGQLQLPGKWTLYDTEPFSEGMARVSLEPFETVFMNETDFAFQRVLFPGEDGAKPRVAPIDSAGDFHDGLAPVFTEAADGSRVFVYVNTQGEVAFVPDDIDGIKVCDPRTRPEFHNGLVRLVVADNGETCDGQYYTSGLPTYDDAHYIYLDTEGQVVLRQES
jgi:hypothetical protein